MNLRKLCFIPKFQYCIIKCHKLSRGKEESKVEYTPFTLIMLTSAASYQRTNVLFLLNNCKRYWVSDIQSCIALGLLEDDNQWDMTLEEAAICRSPCKIRELFSIIFISSDALSLHEWASYAWNKYKDNFSKDIHHQYFRQSMKNIITYEEIYNRF